MGHRLPCAQIAALMDDVRAEDSRVNEHRDGGRLRDQLQFGECIFSKLKINTNFLNFPKTKVVFINQVNIFV